MERTTLFGLGATPIEDIQINIQARLGEFLSSKQKLNTIASSALDPSIKDEAIGLMGAQLDLESQLPGITSIIDRVKTDTYTMSDIITAGAFYAMMEKHLYDVNDLYGRYSGTAQAGMTGFEYLILALVAGGMIYGLTRK